MSSDYKAVPQSLTSDIDGAIPPPSMMAHDPVVNPDMNERVVSGLGCRQLGALLRLQWLHKKRNCGQTVCELLTPLLLMFIIVVGWLFSLSRITDVPDMVYANDSSLLQMAVDSSIESIRPWHNQTGCYHIPTTSMAVCPKADPKLLRAFLNYTGPYTVPTFDEFVSVHDAFLLFAKNSTLPDILDRLLDAFGSKLDNLLYLGALTFAPDTPQVHELIRRLNATNRLFNQVFTNVYATEDEAISVATASASRLDRTWALMVFHDLDLDAGKVDYTIRMNYSTVPTTRRIAQRFNLGLDTTYQRYFLSGFLSLQHMIERAVLNATSLPSPHQPILPSISNPAMPTSATVADAIKIAKDIDEFTKNQPFNLTKEGIAMVAKQFVDARSSPSPFTRLAAILSGAPSMESDAFWSDTGSGGTDASGASQPYEHNPGFTGIPFPIQKYRGNPFYQAVGPLVGLVMCMSMLYPVSRLIKGIVEDKETRSKETMKMMGMLQWVYVASWFIAYFIEFTIIALGITVILNLSVLSNSQFTLVFMFFWLFVTSLLTFAFLVAVFFSKAKLAGIVGPVILFAAVMPRYAFFSTDGGEMMAAKTMTALFSPTAFTFGADLLMQYEGANLGMSWGMVNSDDFSFARVLLMTILDFFLYAFLAWYLEHVLPNEHGSNRRPWFCCQRAFWCGDDEKNKYIASISNDEQSHLVGMDDRNVEPVTSDLYSKARVQLRTLRRVFEERTLCGVKRTTVAVKGLSLAMYEGQITALLGHNGAGKTTTISMLTGLIAPSDGDCIINGLSVKYQMPEIRKSLGICPQHNVLYNHLSVYEHLTMYATLKGVRGDLVHQAAIDKINEVGLEAKRDVFASALSGGMKRKLSVAIALVGGSRIVFLDEPTSGMDPYSRRATWELLRRNKSGRVIVLTTHFMDEADLLGDRIAIMANGGLRCCGSSLFLKARFGIGYNLTMVKETKECDVEQVSAMVLKHVPTAQVLSTTAGEMAYQLPLSAVKQFADMFVQLESERTALGIGGYGISMTTLEEVFMRILAVADEDDGHTEASPSSAPKLPPPNKKSAASVQEIGSVVAHGDDDDTHDHKNGTNGHSHGNGRSLNGSGSNKNGYKVLSKDSSMVMTDSVLGDVRMQPTDGIERIAREPSRATRQFVELLRKRYLCALRDLKGRFFEVLLPVIVVALVLMILRLNISPAGPSLELTSDLYSYKQLSVQAKGVGDGNISPVPTSPSFQHMEPWTNSFMDGRPAMSMEPMNGTHDSLDASYWLLQTTLNHTGNRYAALLVNDTVHLSVKVNITKTQTIDVPWNSKTRMTLMHNSTFFHALPIMSAEVTQARLRTNTWKRTHPSASAPPSEADFKDDPTSDAYYRVSNYPLPLTSREAVRIETFLTLFAALFVLIPFCYLPASFVLFVVKERSVKAQHLQLVSGVKPAAYWTSNYVWDIINYLFVVACVMLVFLAYGNAQFVGTNPQAFGTLTLLIFYGLASIPLSYCYSFIFENHTSAQVGIAGLHFVSGFVLVIASFILDSVDTTKDTNAVMKHMYRFSPAYNLGEGLIQISTLKYYALYRNVTKGAFDWDVLGRSLAYLAGESIIFFFVTLAIEVKLVDRCRKRIFGVATVPIGDMSPPDDEDVDVARERTRIEGVRDALNDDIVRIQQLRKVYPPRGGTKSTAAVHNLSLGVPKSQCFGFLGINGAGKTTTMQMLTGDTEATAGNGWINSYSILNQMEDVRREVGYCPQFDPLLDLMTAREHLLMYGRFRGLPESKVGSIVENMLQHIGLSPFADKVSQGYSGGNKRKLSLAIALIGDPSVVFLDEPSTGMDPVSRRFMWSLIMSFAEQRSLVLTTHSMEECEALCSRIGIMVSGKLQCLGTIQHLKSRFGAGYHMEINASERGVPRVRDFVEKHFKAAVLEEFHAGRLKYKLPKQDLSLSAIFRTIEHAKTELEIDDYSVSQSTLEQIFIMMAKKQYDEQGDQD